MGRRGEHKLTVRLSLVDEARLDALLRAGVFTNTAEAIRAGLRELAVRHRLEGGVVGEKAIADARARIAEATLA